MNKKSIEKVILHFDSTTRSRINGDWPSSILNVRSPPNVSNKFTLRPLFFAFEGRQNISRLIGDTLYRLSVTVATIPKILWELIGRFMTDSVTKNLQVENLVAEELGSDHIPPHYLCNAHASEKLVEALLSVLTSLRDITQRKIGILKAFYRGRKSFVECTLFAICKLITPDT